MQFSSMEGSTCNFRAWRGVHGNFRSMEGSTCNFQEWRGVHAIFDIMEGSTCNLENMERQYIVLATHGGEYMQFSSIEMSTHW